MMAVFNRLAHIGVGIWQSMLWNCKEVTSWYTSVMCISV